MSDNWRDWCEQIKRSAEGQWPDILQSLGRLEAIQVNSSKSARNKGTSCPVCGGNDRYSFKDANAGGWGCRQCGGGDGIEMLQRINAWPFKTTMKEIANYLGIDPYNGECIDPYIQRIAQERTKQRKEELLQKQQQESQQQAAKAEKSAAFALWLWNQSVPARQGHPYLDSHCLSPFNLRETQHNHYGWCLLVPLFNEFGELRNLQYIMADPEMDKKGRRSDKRFIKDGTKEGLFYRFYNPSEDPTWTIYICEGWATGAAIHLNMPNLPTVLCAMDAKRLEAVTEIALRLFPGNRIVIAADHDEPGIRAAHEVARKFDLKVVLPPTPGEDFCDMHINRKKEIKNELRWL